MVYESAQISEGLFPIYILWKRSDLFIITAPKYTGD